MPLNKLAIAPELTSVVTRKHKGAGFLVLGVQANPGDEFKQAIILSNWWAREGGKKIRSFDVLLFTPTNYHGIEIPLYEHSGFASFVAVYYTSTCGAFPVTPENYPFVAVPLSPVNSINPLTIK